MLSETFLRRPEFSGGMSIALADGQHWAFPDPIHVSRRQSEDPSSDASEYTELLDAIRESDDYAGLRLAELALAIYLLGRNYHLSAPQFRTLLEFDASDPALVESQRAFHELAVRAIQDAPPPETVPRGTWSWSSLFSPLIERILGACASGGRAGTLGGESRS